MCPYWDAYQIVVVTRLELWMIMMMLPGRSDLTFDDRGGALLGMLDRACHLQLCVSHCQKGAHTPTQVSLAKTRFYCMCSLIT